MPKIDSGKPDMRIARDFAVLSHNGTLKYTGRCDQQLIGWIAMERLWQFSGFDYDLRMEVQKGNTRLRKGILYPQPDFPIKLQPPVLHEFGHFPTRDDADAEDPVGTKLQKFSVPQAQLTRP
jgi:hypothetical protein